MIHKQIFIAGRGVQDAVDKEQTKTGVKDVTACHWIQILIEKARQLQHDRIKNEATRDPRLNDRKFKGREREAIINGLKDKIQQELFDWVVTQPPDCYAKLAATSRLSPALHFLR
jgi:hypothetical protein